MKRCGGCGAELEPESASCPLCGSGFSAPGRQRRQRSKTETYQASLRNLRRQLDQLRRDDAEAV